MDKFNATLTFSDGTTNTTYTFNPKTYMRGYDAARIFQLFSGIGSSSPAKDDVDDFIHKYNLSQFFIVTQTPVNS